MKHFIITIFLAHLLFSAFAQGDVIIQAPEVQVDAGDEITYPITINPNGNSVGALKLEIEYDSSLFEVLDAQGGNGWIVTSNIDIPGTIIIVGFNFSGQSTTAQAVNITFNAIGQAGQTNIQLNVEIVSDNSGEILNYQSFDGSILISCTETACDDNDDCTINDTYDSNCECIGTFQDTDNDGICDADDQCPGQNDSLIGTACDDNDDCTTNDTYNFSCECIGTIILDCGSCRQTDSLTLVELYNATGGPNWTNTWDLSQPIDTWTGVTLEGGCVSILVLQNAGLSGSIPASIGSLSNLKGLYLSGNQLSYLPESIGDLTNLTSLAVNNNQLTTLPESIGNLSELNFLYLPHNEISVLPASIGNLNKLSRLYMSNNQLTTLPPEIGNLSQLYSLHLERNQLHTLPANMGNLSELRTLWVHRNQITGSLPNWLANLNNLNSLVTYDNQFSGCFSDDLAVLCAQLTLYNSNNFISNGNNFNISWEDFCNGTSCSTCGDDANTLLLLPFNNTLNGVDGETPTTSAHLSYTTGAYNEAMNILEQSDTPLLRYPASGNINSQAGTVEAWVKPTWNGNDGVARTILQYGGGGILVTKDGANNLRLILNRFSPAGYPEVGVGYNISDWQPGQWKHVAFTWEQNGTSKLYINGSLVAHENHNVTLFPISDTEFSVGVEVSYFHWQGAIDHFRISNVVRSQSDIIQFMNNCVETKIADNQTIDMSNFPNPFTNQTTITYTLPEDSSVTLTIYDATGRQVALLHDHESKSGGTHAVNFEADNYPAGVYYCTIQAGTYSGVQKMILTR